MLISLDPGMNSPGVAIFFNNTLFAAGRVSIPDSCAQFCAGRRWYEVGLEVVNWISAHTKTHTEDVTLVFEKPQWYQRAKSKGDPNDIAGVAGVAANVCGLLRPDDVRSPTPAEWIGQLSKVCPTCKGKKTAPPSVLQQMMDNARKKRVKRVCSDCASSAWGTPRGRRIWSKLSPAEQQLCPDQNDAIDAVGIGLWALGRLERVSVFSNGHDGR